MTLHYAKVLKRGEYGAVKPVASGRPSANQARVVPREVVDASEQARAILAQAEGEALKIIEQAQRTAAEVRLAAEVEARAEASASLAARAVALRSRELASAEQHLDQLVELARVLAERLLGEALRLDGTHVLALARQALSEARGARQIVLEAHPDDARVLGQSLATLGLPEGCVRIHADAARARGNLRITTEVGVLDASLGPQLDRLAVKLRESLGT